MFSQENKKAIRLYTLEGTSPVGGTCLYEYKVINIRDFTLENSYFDKFEKNLKEQNSNNNENDLKIMLKYYPVYNFDFIEPPSGNDVNQCSSELLY